MIELTKIKNLISNAQANESEIDNVESMQIKQEILPNMFLT